MGRINTVWNHYLRDKRRFADLFNGIHFRGKQLIKPENLTNSSETYEELEGVKPEALEYGERLARMRDIKMTLQNGQTLCTLGLENQNAVNYIMPFRHMQYDCMDYGRQINDLHSKNNAEKNYANWAEQACGFKKADHLVPVYTLCFYHGEDTWDGPRTLKDMMQFSDEDNALSILFADYPFHLYCLNEETDFSVFHTELRQVFELLQYRRNKTKLRQLLQTNPAYKHMDSDTLELLSVTLNIPQLWEERAKYMKKEDEKEEYNMCQALMEIFADERNAGLEEGIKEKTLQIVENMVKRGMPDDDIKAIAECEQDIIDIVRKKTR